MMRKLFIYGCLITLFAGTLSSSTQAQTITNTEVQHILGRLRDLMDTKNPIVNGVYIKPSADSIRKLMNTLQPDGSWKNIDYMDMRVAYWPGVRHLYHVEDLLKSYNDKQSSLYHNEQLEKDIHLALGFWITHNVTNENWWWNEIGAAMELTNIFIRMDDTYTRDEFIRALNLLRGSYLRQTGQNLIWRADIQLKIGLLGFNLDLQTNYLGSPEEHILESIEVLKKQVVVGDVEGIQADWSFHQHGVQQQFGNYGLSYLQSLLDWAWVLKDTPFRFEEDKIDILKNYLLKGTSWLVWKNRMDISGTGRQFIPTSVDSKGQIVVRLLHMMAEIDTADTSLYASYADFLQNGGKAPESLTGNKFFWNSDLMIHRNSKDYISVRTHSNVIQSTESGVGENMKGAYLADGATYVYRSGDEYHNIYPYWNWARIPGITSYASEPVPQTDWNGHPNKDYFVGGVSDGQTGLDVMLFKRDQLTAYKSWFFTPVGVVCLGTGITADKNTDVSTTINQPYLNGPITVGSKRKTVRIRDIGNGMDGNYIRWVFHDSTGYLFLTGENIHVSADKQSGKWSTVYNQGDTATIGGNIFNLWVDHGTKPVNQSYAYLIAPSVSLTSFQKIVRDPPLRILQNDTIMQAIQFAGNKMSQIVFYKPGKIDLKNSMVIQADNPCLLIAESTTPGLKITLSSPPKYTHPIFLDVNGHVEDNEKEYESAGQHEGQIIISVNGRYSCDGCEFRPGNNTTEITFHLPDGPEAGKSISKTINLSNTENK